MTPEGVTCARLRLAHVTPSGVTSKNPHTLYTISSIAKTEPGVDQWHKTGVRPKPCGWLDLTRKLGQEMRRSILPGRSKRDRGITPQVPLLSLAKSAPHSHLFPHSLTSF